MLIKNQMQFEADVLDVPRQMVVCRSIINRVIAVRLVAASLKTVPDAGNQRPASAQLPLAIQIGGVAYLVLGLGKCL